MVEDEDKYLPTVSVKDALIAVAANASEDMAKAIDSMDPPDWLLAAVFQAQVIDAILEALGLRFQPISDAGFRLIDGDGDEASRHVPLRLQDEGVPDA